MTMTIRPYEDADEEQVIALWHRCHLVGWNDPKREFLLKRQAQPALFLVGLIDGDVAATVMAGYDGHRGWLNLLAVAPERQRQGLGRQIVAEAEARLRA